MKILMINSVCGIKSTGRICTNLAKCLDKQGHIVKIGYGRGVVPEDCKKYGIKIGNHFDLIKHVIKSRIFDSAGFESNKTTIEFIDWIDKFKPDIIHLHNIHGYYINIKILFEYLSRCNKPVFWTLHDCWPLTGHCTYFDYCGCDKWKSLCYDCQQKNNYPKSLIMDRSRENYQNKREIFGSLSQLVIITPSEWLSSIVKESYLNKYEIYTIHNGVNQNIFKPTKNDLKEKLNIQNKKIILGVASEWDKRKGYDDFIKLSYLLPDEYVIILIGLKNKLIKKLPKNVIGIEFTNSVIELAQYYTMSDIFVNLTYEENYPTTNLEAISCGTPVITYNTGGSSESALKYGCVVNVGDIQKVLELIFYNKFVKKTMDFSIKHQIEKYLNLYNKYL